jgi:hypothetical protein
LYKRCLEAMCVSPGGIAASACLVFVLTQEYDVCLV